VTVYLMDITSSLFDIFVSTWDLSSNTSLSFQFCCHFDRVRSSQKKPFIFSVLALHTAASYDDIRLFDALEQVLGKIGAAAADGRFRQRSLYFFHRQIHELLC
jgi:hypothetical protein